MLLIQALARIKILIKRGMVAVGVPPETGLILVAGVIGLLTSVAAIAFHELIELLRHTLYVSPGKSLYQDRLWLLVLIPAAGGLVVGLVARYVLRGSVGGHGVVDVIESVIRTRGFARPISAVEKILTSGVTIGTGGSTGAEGPIVQIGAAISSFVGQMLSVSRHRMPLLIGCGTASGISSIFHCPMGGVMFTLEVILRDFSAPTLVPVVVASIVANVATYAIMSHVGTGGYSAIFAVPAELMRPDFTTTALGAVQFIVLGALCGGVGVGLTRSLILGDRLFAPLRPLGPFRPALGGAMLGLLGVAYILVFGRLLAGTDKPLPINVYPLPVFFGDGYGVIRALLDGSMTHYLPPDVLLLLLLALPAMKILATVLTLSSGGSGGVIAPALFLGASTGAMLGTVSPYLGGSAGQAPALAIIGMGACLAAVVHAPLASILMLFELTLSPGVIVPAMLATVTAHGLARTVMRDSIYTLTLRQRGLSPEAAQDMSALRKFTIDHLKLEPIVPLLTTDPASRSIELATESDRTNYIVVDASGAYRGMLTGHEIRLMLLEPHAIPLMTVGEVMRHDIQPVRHTENLQSLFDLFLRYEVDALPVGLDYDPNRIIGIVTRDALLKHYHRQWATKGE
ncbi:MAG TPA: chloride channel protein [Tepidisphaeraceae bacterium]|jgi:CIC family chloride channel protein